MRFSFKMISGLVGAVLLSLSSGCFFSSGTPPAAFYSLRSTAKHSVLPVRLGSIRNLSGAGREFLVRQEGERMAADPLRSWLELPEVMLERSLRERFDLAGGKVLNAVICRQEISAVDKVLHYHVLFEVITPAGMRREFRCEAAVPVQNDDVAAAMSEGMKQILDRMEKYILEQK